MARLGSAYSGKCFWFFFQPLLSHSFPTVMSAEILLTPLRTAVVESLLQFTTSSTTTTTMLFTEAPPSSQPPLSPSVTSPSGVSLQTRLTRESRPHVYRRAGETRVQPPPAPPPPSKKTLNIAAAAAAARFPYYRLAEVSAPNEPAVSHRAGESVQRGEECGVGATAGDPPEHKEQRRADANVSRTTRLE